MTGAGGLTNGLPVVSRTGAGGLTNGLPIVSRTGAGGLTNGLPVISRTGAGGLTNGLPIVSRTGAGGLTNGLPVISRTGAGGLTNGLPVISRTGAGGLTNGLLVVSRTGAGGLTNGLPVISITGAGGLTNGLPVVSRTGAGGLTNGLLVFKMMIFTAVAIFSVASLNLSLLTNSVGFYQISKLCVIPFVCAVERLWIGKHFSWPVLASAGVVMSGVAVVTVSDVEVRPLGLIIAGTSVVLSGMQQILCAKMQSDLGLASHQLLANSAPAQGVILWMFGPYLDKAITGHSFMAYEWNIQAIGVLCASCTLAILVNVSQFMCLGRFSAFTFQILGHAKTMLVLIIAWLFLGDTLSPRKALGMSLAILGMIMYGVCMKNQAKAVRKVPVQVVAQAGGVTPRRGSTGGADPEKCSLLK
eukprot:gene14735-20780_t